MLKIGCRLSSAKGFLAMGKNTVSIGTNIFQFLTCNPHGSKAKGIDPADAAALRELAQREETSNTLAHTLYTLDACSIDPKVRKFALFMVQDDLQRMEYLSSSCYNLHPSSHTRQEGDVGTSRITQLFNEIPRPEQTTTVLLETMAEKGTEIGGSFSQLHRILDQVSLTEKMGVCLDTCHVYDTGYDLVNDLNGVLAQFDQEISLSWLRTIRLNDSMNPLFSHKNRHQRIGQGSPGFAIMKRITNHPTLRELFFYPEASNELSGYAQEIRLLKSLYRKPI